MIQEREIWKIKWSWRKDIFFKSISDNGVGGSSSNGFTDIGDGRGAAALMILLVEMIVGSG